MSTSDKKVSRNRGGRPVNEDRRKIESSMGITARRAQQLIKEMGLDKVKDLNELKLWEKRIVIAIKEAELESDQIQLGKDREELISRDKVREDGARIGAALAAECAAMENDFPSQVAGKDERGVREKLTARLSILIEKTNNALADV